MSFCTDPQLLDYVAAQMRLAGGRVTLAEGYAELATRANNFAYGEIVRRLLNRGYLKATIDAWDHGPEFQLDLGAWFLFRSAASLQADDTWPEKFNRREELDTVAIVVADELAEPDSGDAAVLYGRMDVYDDVTLIEDEEDL